MVAQLAHYPVLCKYGKEINQSLLERNAAYNFRRTNIAYKSKDWFIRLFILFIKPRDLRSPNNTLKVKR